MKYITTTIITLLLGTSFAFAQGPFDAFFPNLGTTGSNETPVLIKPTIGLPDTQIYGTVGHVVTPSQSPVITPLVGMSASPIATSTATSTTATSTMSTTTIATTTVPTYSLYKIYLSGVIVTGMGTSSSEVIDTYVNYKLAICNMYHTPDYCSIQFNASSAVVLNPNLRYSAPTVY